jgi:hypothetical protein
MWRYVKYDEKIEQGDITYDVDGRPVCIWFSSSNLASMKYKNNPDYFTVRFSPAKTERPSDKFPIPSVNERAYLRLEW